jgi:exo-beta-1,3-glucanase (GH17 family)
MFEAAERNGMKIILGLYPGDYSKTDPTDPTKYNINAERNKMLFDEVYEQFGNNPCLVGWYITEEFHDGSYPVGWQQEPALSMLAKYLEGVASYIKTKSNKPVSIAPALWI